MRAIFHRKCGISTRVVLPLFEGYVIVETDLDYVEYKSYANAYIKPLDGVLRLLEQDVIGSESILPHERTFIEKFTSSSRVIEPSYGIIQEDKVKIIEGPLAGREREIIRIDRHKRLAEICVNMFGEVHRLKLSCEILPSSNKNHSAIVV